jgi:hypothetical protein
MTQCYQVCKIVQQNPTTDMCRFTHLSSGGRGCTVACQEDLQPGDVVDMSRFEYFYRSSCQLTWRIKSQTNKNVVFIIAGQDQGGMWHFVAGNLTSSKLDMAAGFGTKYPTVAVIAVDSQMVLDILMVNLPRYQECVREEHSVVTVPGDDLIIVIVLSVVVVTLFIILLAIVCCKKYEQDGGRRSHTENLDTLIAAKHKQQLERVSGIKSTKLSQDNYISETVIV